MIRILKFAALSALILSLLTGCVSLLPDPTPPASIYRLGFADAVQANDADATVIRIDRPAAAMFFETKDIIVSNDGRRLVTAAGAKWAEVMPVLVQESLISAMATSPKIIGVIPSSGARTNTRVHLTIKNFEAQFDKGEDAAPMAIVRYDLTLSNASNRDLIATHSVRQTARATEVRVSSIVTAIEQANQAAMRDIVTWLEGQSSSNAL